MRHLPLRHRPGRRSRVRPRSSTRSCSARCSTARPTSSTARGSSAASRHRVLYFWHYVGNRCLTTASNMVTNLNLTDMETCYKAFRLDALRRFAARGEPLRHRARDHRQGRPARAHDLRGRHQLRRSHVRRRQEDRLARRRARPVLYRRLLGNRRSGRGQAAVAVGGPPHRRGRLNALVLTPVRARSRRRRRSCAARHPAAASS